MKQFEIAVALFFTLCCAGCVPTTTAAPINSQVALTQSEPIEVEPDIADFIDFAKRDLDIDPRNVGIRGGDAVEIRRPDSAGGVDLGIYISNVSSQDFDYVVFTVVPYNAVGDPVSSEIGGDSAVLVQFTGPLQRSAASVAYWENVWYNGTIEHVEVVGVEIEFSDDSVLEFDLGDRPIRGNLACIAVEGFTEGECRLADPL